MKSVANRLIHALLCLCLCFLLTGCNNYSRLFRAIGNRMTANQTEETRSTTRQTTATTRQTTTAAPVTPAETTTGRTEQTTTPATTTSTTSTTATTSRTPNSTYTIINGYSYEQGSVSIFVPYVMPEDEASAPLNTAFSHHIADEQAIVAEGFEEDIFYQLDYYYQFDGNCLTLALERIVGWVDSEGYFSYDVYHYDFDTRSFLDNAAYLAYLGLVTGQIEAMVQSYFDDNLDPEWFAIRPVAEAVFVIFDDILYYEVISLEYEDFWLEEIGSVR